MEIQNLCSNIVIINNDKDVSCINLNQLDESYLIISNLNLNKLNIAKNTKLIKTPISINQFKNSIEFFLENLRVFFHDISIDKEKLQIGCSIKQLSPDPFEHISNYEIGKKYKVKVEKITDYGCFCSLEPGLSTLLHSSEMRWAKRNITPKNILKYARTGVKRISLGYLTHSVKNFNFSLEF